MTLTELIKLLQKEAEKNPDAIVEFKTDAYDGEVYPITEVQKTNSDIITLFP